ncbi:unnamed protein product [Brachionus calyciflorus]|uniref:RNA-directed DNA polymerase from mobile element jockey-like n=1 Tax=Brachionus calyciflorus TaxID=104777 RepID=A0A814H8R5_9BILA|nr:unnamed protein product [Brachionus calyciflorus]
MLDNIDWEERFKNLYTQDSYQVFLEYYNEISKKCIAAKNIKSKKHPPRLSKDLINEVKLKKRLWKRYLASNKNKSVFDEYNIQNKLVKKSTKLAVKNYEIKLANLCKTNPKLFYHYVNGQYKPREPVNVLRNLKNELTTNLNDISETLNHQFHSVFVNKNTKVKLLIDSNDIFSVENVFKKLEKIDQSKGMGNDDIHPKVLKETSHSIVKPLSLLFIKSYTTGEVPSEWREANITPLHKKGSKLEAANYRPVSLTSIVCKIMESIIKDEVLNHLKKNKLVSKE